VCCERSVTPPFGLAGGLAGGRARLTLELPDGTKRTLLSKGTFVAPAGSRVAVEAPGSGGYGPPAGRERRKLQDDLADGYVSPDAALQEYGWPAGRIDRG
jgi:N-methylhydantoinase B